MTADVMSAKTEALGWKPKKKLKEYIDELNMDGWRK
jgi:UDP-glucose 4-epimerase